MSTRPLIGSLCSGYGGLDLAVEQFFRAETVWFSEFEDAPSRVLEAHWPGVPNLGDMTLIDWATVPRVDILAGGTPCQDLSAAGKRKGMSDGTRSNLWVQMREAIATLRPSVVIWENVRGALSAYATSEMELEPGLLGESYGPDRPALRALGRVLGDLADLGFDAEWVGLRAADVGAPHGRFRIFVIAVATDADRTRLGSLGRLDAVRRDADGRGRADRARDAGEPSTPAYAAGDAGRVIFRDRAAAADAGGEARELGAGLRASGPRWLGRGRSADDAVEAAADADRVRWDEGRRASAGRASGRANVVDRNAAADPARVGLREDEPPVRQGEPDPSRGRGDAVEWGVYEQPVRRWEHALGRVAPAPTNADGKGGAHRLAPEFVEWMMGAPEGWVTDPSLGVSRAALLKMLGNGVVTQQAHRAISIGWARLADVRGAVAA